MKPNGAADKPRRAGKPQAFPPGVGLIRVVVRREAPSNRRMAIRRPVVAGAKRPRQRLASAARVARRLHAFVRAIGINRASPFFVPFRTWPLFHTVYQFSSPFWTLPMISVERAPANLLDSLFISAMNPLLVDMTDPIDWFVTCWRPSQTYRGSPRLSGR